MNAVTKQSVLDMLEAAKTHIEAGETTLATEKIDEAIAAVENEGTEPTAEGEGNTDPENPPLPGTGNNGVIP